MPYSASSSSAAHENGGSTVVVDGPTFAYELERYANGSLLSITLVNFMIHERLHVDFGCSCNLLMGPNGSGKSSVVCGLVLGLGGDHRSVLSRGKSITSFIKNTANEAKIKLTVLDADRNVRTITRQLVREWNSARRGPFYEWFIEDRPVSFKHVTNLVQSLGVHVDSLCQILPQEKVGDFTKLTPKALLRETEKTMADGGVHKTHMELVEMQREKIEHEKMIGKKEEALTTAEAMLRHLELRKEANRNVEVLKEDIKRLTEYRPAFKHKQLVKQKKELKNEDTEHSKRLQETTERATALKKEVNTLSEKAGKFLQNTKSVTQEIQDIDASISNLYGLVRKRRGQIDEYYNEALHCQKKVDERDDRIASLEDDIEVRKKKLDEIPPSEEVKAQRKPIRGKIRDVSRREEDAAAERQQEEEKTTELENRLNSLDKQKNAMLESRKRLENCLRNRANRFSVVDGALKGWDYVKNNRWIGYVYGPLCVHVTPSSRLARIALDNFIPLAKKMTFICSSPDDSRRLYQQDFGDSRVRKKLQLYLSQGETPNPRRLDPTTLQKLKDNGLTATLDEVISCPDIVRSFLISRCAIDRVLLFEGQETPDIFAIGELIPPGYRALTTQAVVEKREGCMTGTPVINHRSLQQEYNSCFHSGPDQDKLKRVNDSIDDARKEYEEATARLRQAQEKENEVMKRKKELQKEMDKNRQMDKDRLSHMEEIEKDRRELEALKNESVEEIQEKQREYTQQLCELCGQLAEEQPEIASLLKDRQQLVKKRVVSKISHETVAGLQDCIKHTIEELKNMEKDIGNNINFVRRKFKDVHAKEQEARKHVGDPFPSNDWLEERENICKKHHMDPNASTSPFELDQLIQRLREALTSQDEDRGIADRYEQKKKDVEHTKRLIAEKKERVAKLEKDIAEKFTQWEIQYYVTQIGAKFTAFMKQVGYDGKICLLEQDHYEDYGLSVMVSFKKGAEPQELNVTVQSGGERAVATMVFMLSLQSLTRCPFRVIDEINQGMDENNERELLRVVFNGCSPEETTRQYIIVTPKILRAMNYPDHVLVHTVYNGAQIYSSPKLSFQEQIKELRAKRQRLQ
eukprot:gb/GECG01005981.1/.p1 GENE.gb/GECG01005981.1/~~gb/GECG01005981.1/.p1  ORF type:complete len:1089 (+),score=166.12 gb/GECG01005981.1/:1-3267(+)